MDQGKEVLTIGDRASEVWRPAFAPNDSILYFIQMEKNGLFGIKSFNLQTNTITNVLKADYNIWDIAVSPSGNKIAYAGNKDGNWDLFIYDIPTKQINQLTKTIGHDWDPIFLTEDELWFAGEFGFNNGIYHVLLTQ